MRVERASFTELWNIPPHPYDGDPDWQKAGACVGRGTTLFFPPRGTSRERILEAKNVCAGCPIKQKCLDYALYHGDRHGIWGGTTEFERRRLKLKQSIDRPVRRKRTITKWIEVDDDADTETSP